MKATAIVLLSFLGVNGFAQSAIKAGEPAPAISITNWLLNLPSDTVLTNKYIVLEFWATWCAPCLAAAPHMNDLQARFSQPDLYFLSMTYEAPEVARKVFKRVDFHSAVVTDESGQTQINFGDGRKGLSYYPLAVLIDNENIIRWYGNPMELNDTLMGEFLKNKTIAAKATAAEQQTNERANGGIPERMALDRFSALFDDPAVTWMVHLVEVPEPPKEKTAGFLLPGSNGYNAFISLKDLLRQLFPQKRFVVPASFENRYYNFAFLDKKPSSDSEGRLQAAILKRLGLEARVTMEPTTHYSISIKNRAALVPMTEGRFSSHKEDGSGNLVFSKYSIADMLVVLSERTDSNWSFQGKDKGKYAFTINMESPETMVASLEKYGFKVKAQTGKIETVYLSEP